jgi:hypothetical protein
MHETATQRRIRKAVEAKGGTLLSARYEQPHGMVLMEGPEGGWLVEAQHPRQPNPAVPLDATGYTADQVIEFIDEVWPEATDPNETPKRDTAVRRTCQAKRSEQTPLANRTKEER